jgi:hypothetical protein
MLKTLKANIGGDLVANGDNGMKFIVFFFFITIFLSL